MEIKIRSTQFIKPSKSTPENQRNFKLSFLDQLAPSSSIHLIFYYKSSCDDHELTISDRRNQLIRSLSEALTSFYPLSGRITEDELAVDCSDQGVKYVETQVSIRFDDFLKQGPKSDHINQLVDAQDQAMTTSLITIQVNLFDCGSLAIGVSASHKVTDACTLVMFINEWARTNRTGVSNGDFNFDNLASFFPPRKILSSTYSPNIPNHPEAILLTKRFVFNGASISKLRAKASSLDGNFSRVTLVASLIWKTLISIDQVNSGGLFRDCLLAPAMNLRGKVGLPISKSSFGNVWAPYPIRYRQNVMRLTYDAIVSLIEETTRNTIKMLSTASCEEICTHAMECHAKVAEELKQNRFCIFSSWCRFPLYEVDFGWGKPFWACEAGNSVQMAILMDDKHGEGIEAWVSLNEKDMYFFEQDQEILAFTS